MTYRNVCCPFVKYKWEYSDLNVYSFVSDVLPFIRIVRKIKHCKLFFSCLFCSETESDISQAGLNLLCSQG